MNPTLATIFRGAAIAVVAGLPWSSVLAQAPAAQAAAKIKVTADEPAFEELFSPELGSAKGKSFKPKEWLEIETKLNVVMEPEPKSKTCDGLTVKWYLAVANPEKPRTMLLISRTVEYVNLPLGEDIYCSAYLSPASSRRILGDARNVKKVVEFVGFEILYNGEIVAGGSNKSVQGRKDWWNIASQSLARTDSVTLLDKSETPFAHMWWDRYAEVKVDKN